MNILSGILNDFLTYFHYLNQRSLPDSIGKSELLGLASQKCFLLFVIGHWNVHLQVIEAPLPKPLLQVGVVPHWLAIDGVQPRIPENEVPEKPKAKRPRPVVPNSRNVKPKLEQGRTELSYHSVNKVAVQLS